MADTSLSPQARFLCVRLLLIFQPGKKSLSRLDTWSWGVPTLKYFPKFYKQHFHLPSFWGPKASEQKKQPNQTKYLIARNVDDWWNPTKYL
jgi:hypothetical protein